MTDPIVSEVRHFRMEHTRKCNSDLATICQDIRAIQARCGHKVVRLPPKGSSQQPNRTRLRDPRFARPTKRSIRGVGARRNDDYTRTT